MTLRAIYYNSGVAAISGSAAVTVGEANGIYVTGINMTIFTTATVGTRIPIVMALDANGTNIHSWFPNVTVVASKTLTLYSHPSAQALITTPVLVNGFPLQPTWMPSGALIHPFDYGAVDSANDTYTLAITGYTDTPPASPQLVHSV